MEYDDSISLYDFMRNDNGFTESELREIAGCCLLGLDHLHKRNLRTVYVTGLELSL